MPGEVQAVRATPRWPADREQFTAGWQDLSPARSLFDVMVDDERGAPEVVEIAIERALADALGQADSPHPTALALLTADVLNVGPDAPLVLRHVARTGEDTTASLEDVTIHPEADVATAVARALRDRIETRAAVACPLVSPRLLVQRPVGWLVALTATPSPDTLARWSERMQAVLEDTAWAFALAVTPGWGSWRTRGFFGADWPGLQEHDRSTCRIALEFLRGGADGHRAPSAGATPEPEPTTLPIDDNVQFTVYRPRRLPPETWRSVLAFAHLAERRPDAPADSPDPIEEVRRQAHQALGAQAAVYADVTQDAGHAIPRAGAITFALDLPGLDVNPPQRSFRWVEDVQREEFRVRAPASLGGRTVRGALRVHLGALLVGEVRLAIPVDASATPQTPGDAEAEHARPYRRIFPSYSHRDEEIVRQVETYARTMGDEYLRDITHLRAGETWNDRLLEFIRTADVFQLFWSRNSMRSPWVRQEWEYALSLGRPHFVRPTYWETPLPEAPDQDLPPASLRALHFQRLPVPASRLDTRRYQCGDREEKEEGTPSPPSPAAATPPDDNPALRPHPVEIDASMAERAEEWARRDRERNAAPPPRTPRRRRPGRLPGALVALLFVGFIGGSLMWRSSPVGRPPDGDLPAPAAKSPAPLEASSPDGRVLASMDATGRIRISSHAGNEPVTIATAIAPADVVALRFSSDGNHLVCELRDGTTVAWDARTGARVAAGARAAQRP